MRTSYVDSLLFKREFQAALSALEGFKFSVSDDEWVAHEFGRAYLGLHRYKDAVSAFETQMALKPEPIVFHMLARAYHRTGDKNNVLRVLRAGRNWYPEDKQLKIDYAAQLVRLGQEADRREAEEILNDLQVSFPSDGRVLQQLCKLLCGEGRIDEAERAVRGQVIYPERYRIPISVEISIGRRRFEEALSALQDSTTDDEHLIGLTRKVYLRWRAPLSTATLLRPRKLR